MTDGYYIGVAYNARSRHRFQVQETSFQTCKERLEKYCNFWEISHFKIYSVEVTDYYLDEEKEALAYEQKTRYSNKKR